NGQWISKMPKAHTEALPINSDGETSRRKPFPRYQRAVMGLRDYWYPAAMAYKVPKVKPFPIKILGEELVLVRDAGKIYCLQGRCAHRGVPLSEAKREFPCTV